MVTVQLLRKPPFFVTGKRVWISGQDNAQFAGFWAQCHADGTIPRLKQMALPTAESVTGASILGVSHVENDPDNRAFFFDIASETRPGSVPDDLCGSVVPACLWAIFTPTAADVAQAVLEAEMYAFMQWLPASGMRHANTPELETYPPHVSAQFWLPVVPQ